MTPAIRRILLPTDLSPFSEHTVAYAASLAEGLAASLHLVHVLDDPGAVTPGRAYRGMPSTGDSRYHAARGKLAALAARTIPTTIGRVSIEVRVGAPWKAIVDAAVDYGADLIVMSTPVSTVATLVVGTVAERVSRSAPCPVLTVRHPRHDDRGHRSAA